MRRCTPMGADPMTLTLTNCAAPTAVAPESRELTAASSASAAGRTTTGCCPIRTGICQAALRARLPLRRGGSCRHSSNGTFLNRAATPIGQRARRARCATATGMRFGAYEIEVTLADDAASRRPAARRGHSGRLPRRPTADPFADACRARLGRAGLPAGEPASRDRSSASPQDFAPHRCGRPFRGPTRRITRPPTTTPSAHRRRWPPRSPTIGIALPRRQRLRRAARCRPGRDPAADDCSPCRDAADRSAPRRAPYRHAPPPLASALQSPRSEPSRSKRRHPCARRAASRAGRRRRRAAGGLPARRRAGGRLSGRSGNRDGAPGRGLTRDGGGHPRDADRARQRSRASSASSRP